MKKISSQISYATIALFLVGIVALLFVVDNLLRKNLQHELIENLKVHCLLIDELLPVQPDSLEREIPMYSRMAGVRITVMDIQGRVWADFDGTRFTRTIENHIMRPEIQMALSDVAGFGYAIRHSGTVDQDLVYTVYKSPKQRFVRVAQNQSFIDGITSQVRFTFYLASVLVVGLMLFLTVRIAKRITRPLTEIIQASSEIKSGNYDKEIIVREDNELGELGRTLNAMSAKLKDDIKQLNKVQEIRKDFVANASHELRTPISSVRGYIETLLDGAYHDEEVSKKFLERAHSNILRLENIVNDMLDLSRLESRDQSLSLRYFNVEQSLRNIVADFEEVARRKNLDLACTVNLPSDFKFIADPYQFDKAVLNLVENAVKYTEKGRVDVRAKFENKKLVVEVEDTGNGIKQEDTERIFERFYRVDRGRSREQGGSGLGLAIVKHVMEIHKGTVRLESEVGKGSRFILTFPV
ncbi:ATP-binding protein [bacterium]|nr:ATP-binding protein [bacterium]NUN45794.1 HAMP domain-containing protein [bacterium]